MNVRLVVVEYVDDRELATDAADDIPMLTRKRCNTMPGTFVTPEPDDMTQDACHHVDHHGKS